MKLDLAHNSILHGILCILSRLKSDENHDTIAAIIVDYLDEIGFKSQTEFPRPYKIRRYGKVIHVKGRLDFFAWQNDFYIAGEIETSKIPTKTIRKLLMEIKPVKLLILKTKACDYSYISPQYRHLKKYLVIPLKPGRLIQSDIEG